LYFEKIFKFKFAYFLHYFVIFKNHEMLPESFVVVFCGNIELGRTRVAVSTFNHQYQPNLIPFNRYIRSNQKPALELAIRNLR